MNRAFTNALCMAFAIFVSAAATAAVPLTWEVKPGQAAPVAFDRFHGESLHLTAEFVGFSEPPFAPGADVRLWYQTNGMGSAWWSVPASVESNRVSAAWSPELDPGAERVTLFFGAPSNAYCSAVLRLRGSPGMVPNALPLPVQRLDFAGIEVSNAPYYTQAEADAKIATAATTLSESFSEWTISPATDQWGDPYTMELSSNDPITGYWKLLKNGSQVAFSTAAGLNATSASFITMYGQHVSAWRSVQGYQLGNDTNHILAAQKDMPGDYATVSNRAMSALQSYTETDPNVPSWAKASSKPSYSWSEIGSKPTFATVATSGSYNDLSDKPTIPTVPTAQINAATTTNALQDAAIAGKADKADATLTERGFSEWQFPGFPEIDEYGEKNLVPYENSQGIWLEYWVRDKDWETGECGDWYVLSSSDNYAPLDATSFTWLVPMGGEEPNEYTGTRTAQSGYQLGTQEGKPLASEAEAEALRTAVAGKQDNLPYPTNAIPYAAISGKPSLATVATSGSYSDLSNKPTIPDISGKADESALAAVAQAATNYTDAAIAAIPEPDLSSYAAASDVATNSADIAALKVESSLVYRLYSGSNVVCEVTNYNSAVRSPTMRLLRLDTNGVYTVVWAETNNLHRVAQAATNYTDAAMSEAVAVATNLCAPRAWSGVTSGLGAEAPPGVTWISTPQTVLAGGFEYAKVVTTSGEAWILTGNGMTAATNSMGYLDISASDGTSIFRIEKTDSYLVGAAADSITRSGNTVTVTIPIVSQDHPLLRYAPSLDSPVTWYNEEDSNLPASVTCSWGGSSGAWVCTITTSAPSGFFRFEFLQQGSTKIVNAGMTDLSGGIWFNGTKYVPTVSGNELKFVAE